MRSGMIWGALACTLLACWWLAHSEEYEVENTVIAAPVVSKQRPLVSILPAPQALVAQQVTQPVLVNAAEKKINLFSALVLPAEQQGEADVPASVNPYIYAGRLQEEGRWVAFLSDGQQQYVVREGDRFVEGWQVTLLDVHKIVLQHAAEQFEIRLDNGVMF